MDRPTISIVIPCYNEYGNIMEMYERLVKTFRNIEAKYEILFINNGSTDNSQELFDQLTQKDKNVIVIELSRNFGSAGPAYTCGLEYATGDCVVMLDGDIQDPPELIKEMFLKWQEGYEVVYGIRKKRKTKNIIRLLGYKLFYKIYHHISYLNMPLDAGDFALMDRKILDIINSMPETNRFVRGLRVWAGFRSTGIEYVRDDRKNGKTKYSFIEYIRSAKVGLFSFSYAPLEYISHIAAIVTLISFAGVVYEIMGHFINPHAPLGFTTLIVTILFLGALQLLCLSVIGEYIGKIFDEVKSRPEYVVKKITNDRRKGLEWEIKGINTYITDKKVS